MSIRSSDFEHRLSRPKPPPAGLKLIEANTKQGAGLNRAEISGNKINANFNPGAKGGASINSYALPGYKSSGAYAGGGEADSKKPDAIRIESDKGKGSFNVEGDNKISGLDLHLKGQDTANLKLGSQSKETTPSFIHAEGAANNINISPIPGAHSEYIISKSGDDNIKVGSQAINPAPSGDTGIHIDNQGKVSTFDARTQEFDSSSGKVTNLDQENPNPTPESRDLSW